MESYEVLGEVPPARNVVVERGQSDLASSVDWPEVIRICKEHPEVAIQFESLRDVENVKSKYQSIRDGWLGIRDLVGEGWRLVPAIRNSHPSADGRRVGDIVLTAIQEP